MIKNITLIKKDLQEINFEIHVKEQDNKYSVKLTGPSLFFDFGVFKYAELENAVADVEKWIYSNYSEGDADKLLYDLGFSLNGHFFTPGTERERIIQRALDVLRSNISREKFMKIDLIAFSVENGSDQTPTQRELKYTDPKDWLRKIFSESDTAHGELRNGMFSGTVYMGRLVDDLQEYIEAKFSKDPEKA